jgi:hypothetical protein
MNYIVEDSTSHLPVDGQKLRESLIRSGLLRPVGTFTATIGVDAAGATAIPRVTHTPTLLIGTRHQWGSWSGGADYIDPQARPDFRPHREDVLR